MTKIANTPAARFTITKRPHGVLICVVADAAEGCLCSLRGDPIPVRGRIAIFGEREGHSRQTSEERRARSPYVAACVVAPASPGGPVEVLKAYLHPCASARHLMPMDSDLERKTFAKLIQLQDWLRSKAGIAITVRKPVFDVSPVQEGEAEGSENDLTGPFIPDFLIEAEHAPAGGAKTVIVETMGYADAIYRQRKLRTQIQMSNLLDGAPIIRHDFHQPEGLSQESRSQRFWSDCRWTITGKTRREGSHFA
jgi:hypothetical protein